MKAYSGSKGKTPLILNLGTRWRWVANFTPQQFNPGNDYNTPQIRGRVGTRDPLDILEKNVLFLSGFENRTIQPVA
jgi:hypothetical protein